MMWQYFAVGGAIIGLAASLLLLANGRIMGASGIIFGALFGSENTMWRWLFLLGMLCASVVMVLWNADIFAQTQTPAWKVIAAGVLVGFGTCLGAGCTSGHGICGISRLSARSLMATCMFVVVAMLTYTLTKNIG